MEAVDDLDDPDREEESEHNWHVSELPEDVDELEIDAVITPDGMWYGSDGALWDDPKWVRTVRGLLKKNPDCIAVRVLLHS